MIVSKKTKPQDKGPRTNREIRSAEVRFIDESGKMVGVISTTEAIGIAEEKGLDLVEVNPNGEPPVVKLIDYGKYKYELKKKQQEAKKKQNVIQLKEIQFRPKIEKHDFDFKVKHIERFILDGDKVKVVVVFRGREMAHPEVGDALIEKVIVATQEFAQIESKAKREGRKILMILGPKLSK